jgi:hypothetical protein
MLRAEYNRLYDVWLSAKPEQIAAADWAAIWKLTTGSVYIQDAAIPRRAFKNAAKVKDNAIDVTADTPWK